MFDNELMWNQFLLERKDAERIAQAKKIYDKYFEHFVKPLNEFFSKEFEIPEKSDARVFPDNSLLFHFCINTLEASKNYNKDDLRIVFTNDKYAKSGNAVGASFHPDINIITVFDTKMNDIVKEIKQIISYFKYVRVKDFNEYILTELKELFHDFFQKLREKESIIIHELIHYLDNEYINVMPKFQKLHSTSDTKDEYFNKYINSFWEVNAYTLESIFKHGHVDTIDEFLKLVRSKDIDWLDNLNDKNKKKVLKRIYDYFQHKNNQNS